MALLGLVMLPQCLYWNYTYGHYLAWTYSGEGFTRFLNPELFTVWFAPQAGLFTYTPLVLVSLCGLFTMRKAAPRNALLVLVVFLGVSYLCATWHDPTFGGGCAFGKRPMIEYFPILFLPLAYLFDHLVRMTRSGRIISLFFVAVCVGYNLLLFFRFPTCLGGGRWDWQPLLGLLQP
jgi:hypothetical protein